MWVWVNSGSWWWTGRPGVLQSMQSQRVGHDWATEINWTELNSGVPRLSDFFCFPFKFFLYLFVELYPGILVVRRRTLEKRGYSLLTELEIAQVLCFLWLQKVKACLILLCFVLGKVFPNHADALMFSWETLPLGYFQWLLSPGHRDAVKEGGDYVGNKHGTQHYT